MADLLSMPLDLHLMVKEYLTSKADLKSLCLTSKQTSALATPRLYKDMVVRPEMLLLAEGERSEIHRLFTINGENMKHVRRLEVLTPRNLLDASELCRLLQVIPDNQLECFGHVIFNAAVGSRH
jgi:hypothetical protein